MPSLDGFYESLYDATAEKRIKAIFGKAFKVVKFRKVGKMKYEVVVVRERDGKKFKYIYDYGKEELKPINT